MTTHRTKLVALSLSLLASAAFARSQQHADWTSFRGPGQGGPAFAGALPETPFGLSVAWRHPLGAGYSNVSVADGTVVAPFTAGEVDVVGAFDITSGTERWRYTFGPKYAGHDGSDDGPVSTPAIADGKVYALGARGELVALSLADGSELWKVTLDESNSTVPFYGYTTAPVVAGDLLLVQTGGEGRSLTAFDRATGAKRWSKGDDGVTYQSPILLELAGRRQLIAVTDFFLHGFNPADGGMLWQFRHTEGGQGEGSAHVTPVDGNSFLVKYGNDTRLYRATKDGVEQAWTSRAFANTFALPVYHDGHFYGFTGRFLTCARASDGEIVWRSRPPGGQGMSLVDGHLAILDLEGNLVLVAASPDGYREVSRVNALGAGDYAVPTFAGGTFFLRNQSEIAAVQLTQGATTVTAAADTNTDRYLGDFGTWVRKVESMPAANRQAEVDRYMTTITTTPVTTADGLAHFLYQGDADDVGLSGDLLAGGRDDVGLFRVDGTNFFYRSLQLDPKGQYSYSLGVGFDQPAPDPRNPRRVDFGFAAASDLRMPGWPAAPHLDDPAEGAPRGTLDSFQFRSEILGNARDIKVYRPVGYGSDAAKRYPVVVITHGDNVLRGGRGQNTLDNVVGNTVEPLIAVFVPRAGRGEFGGPDTDKFVSFLTDELLPHLDRHYTTDPARRAIMGPASAGVTAVYAALSRPDVFPRVGVQSFYEIAATKEALDAKSAATGPKPKFAIVVSSTHDYAIPGGPEAAPPTAALIKALRAAGVETTEFAGTHSPNWIGWAGQDDDILRALFPAAPAAP